MATSSAVDSSVCGEPFGGTLCYQMVLEFMAYRPELF